MSSSSRAARARTACRLALTVQLLATALVAQSPAVRFERLSTEDGLSHSRVWRVYQDSLGFLWFATSDGLDRYDGYGFKTYENDPEDPHSLSHNEVMAVLEDRRGALWIGTRGGGLDRFDRAQGRFFHYRHDPTDPASLSHDTVHNLLWITTLNGLNRLDRETGSFTRYRHDPADETSLSDNSTYSLYEDPQGALWITTRRGLNRFDPHSGGFDRFFYDAAGPGSRTVNDVRADDEGFLWLATESGVVRFDPRNETSRRYRHDPADPHSLASDRVLVLMIDPAGELWIATQDAGLDRLDRSSGRFVHHRHDPADPHSLSSDRVTSVIADATGILWITSFDGVGKYDRRREQFEIYRQHRGAASPSGVSLSSESVFGLTEDRYGELWVGSRDRGLDRIDRERRSVTHYEADPADPYSLPHNNVSAVHEDRSGELWVATIGGGIARFDRTRERFLTYRHDPQDPRSLASDYVMALLGDTAERLWVTTAFGLDRLDRDRRAFVHYPSGGEGAERPTWFTALCEASSGALWFGTRSRGLYRFDPDSESFTPYRHDPADPRSLSDDQVTVLYESRAGTLWVGTLGGLNRLDPERRQFDGFTAADGLAANGVQGIVEDARGHLWISTNRGLSRFDPRSRTFETYTAADGLAGDSFSRRSAWRGRGGEIYFGSYSGLTAFDPERIARDPHPPAVVLTELRLFYEPVAPRGIDPGSPLERSILVTRRLELSHRHDVVAFEFAALHYAQPSRNGYAYRLEGFDEQWVATDSEHRVARYTNLEAGDYVFRVRGSNHHGVWNEEGVALAITIRPAPWETWWARSLYALAFVAAFGGLVGWQRRRLEREQAIAERERAAFRRELESQVDERTSQLAEALAELEAKNAELERFTYTVSHDLRSPLMTIRGFIGLLRRDLASGRTERLESDLDHIDGGAEKMDRLLRELLDLSRIGRQANPPSRVPFAEVVAEAMEAVEGRITERGAEVDVAPDLPEVTGDRLRLVEMMQNLLDNAVCFMGDQERPRVEVGTKQNGAERIFYVRDNGMGIEAKYHALIFGLFERLDASGEGTGVGLAVVKRIVEVHGGRIWVESPGPGQGSTFCFTLANGETEGQA